MPVIWSLKTHICHTQLETNSLSRRKCGHIIQKCVFLHCICTQPIRQRRAGRVHYGCIRFEGLVRHSEKHISLCCLYSFKFPASSQQSSSYMHCLEWQLHFNIDQHVYFLNYLVCNWVKLHNNSWNSGLKISKIISGLFDYRVQGQHMLGYFEPACWVLYINLFAGLWHSAQPINLILKVFHFK